MGDKVLIIGLGETGKPLSNILSKVHDVQTKDMVEKNIKMPIDIMHTCIPADNTNFVDDIVKYAKKYKPKLIINNSTVVPGTSRQIYEKTKINIVYSPIRGKHATMEKDIIEYTKFIAGNNMKAAKKAGKHFREAGLSVQYFKSLETAELAKIISTTYFGLLLSYAQTINRYCKRLDVDYNNLMKIIKEIDYLPRYIFEPGYIGGHCVIQNLNLLEQILHSELIDYMRASNEQALIEYQIDKDKEKNIKDRQVKKPRRIR